MKMQIWCILWGIEEIIEKRFMYSFVSSGKGANYEAFSFAH